MSHSTSLPSTSQSVTRQRRLAFSLQITAVAGIALVAFAAGNLTAGRSPEPVAATGVAQNGVHQNELATRRTWDVIPTFASADAAPPRGSSAPAAGSSMPRSTPGPAAPPWAGGGSVPAHEAPTPPALAEKIRGLEEALRTEPDNVETRRGLALVLLEAERFVDAFHQAETLLAADANDAAGLYVASVVRLRMGQNRQAMTSLEQLVAAHPNHVEGLRVLGLARLRVGEADGAIRAWERGLTAAGGQHGELQRLLSISRSARSEAPAR